ncbi:ribokinase [uncultured Schumannella sp.]|uniref:ribokinase n=1 Tax=uncultured Schumannella sp. TaxID=1195956 RepID=UPI0025D1ACA5|nr:ribokinase [uncultured Schumannella sp.]
MPHIAVLGSANLDFVVTQPRLAKPGETIFGHDFVTVPGGKGLNQAVAAARAGGNVAFLGAVGADDAGRVLRACLDAEGIDLSGLIEVAGATGTAHIAVVDDGENSIVVVPGANAAVTELDDVTRSHIAGASALVLQLERPLELVAEALAFARASGVRTVLTPAPARPLAPELLGLVDILVPNAGEACELAGVDDELVAARALSQQAATVIMTRGAHGSVIARAGEVIAEVPARRVNAVDTTAAGDTFVGALIARLTAGDELDDAVRTASVAASITVTRPGATSSIPTWDEVAAAL